jgi:hypothetical protein
LRAWLPFRTDFLFRRFRSSFYSFVRRPGLTLSAQAPQDKILWIFLRPHKLSAPTGFSLGFFVSWRARFAVGFKFSTHFALVRWSRGELARPNFACNQISR